MHARVLVALLAVAAPLSALADRGALSLEAGGVLAGVRKEPAVGAGDSVTGSVAGATIGARYALSNSVEVTGTVDWFAAAPFYNDNTVIVTGNGTFRGQLQSRVSRYSAKLGAQYVRGLTWRIRVGAEVGWTRLMSERLDLVDVTPAVPRSFGLGLGSRSMDHLVVVGLAGVEWAVSDHVSFAVTPRVEFPFGGGLMAMTVPLTVAYSWYTL
jgi:hypothetical protein